MPIDPENKSRLRNILASIRQDTGKEFHFEFDGVPKREVLEIGENFDGLKRAFFYDLYVTGGRISELLKTRNENRWIEKGSRVYFHKLFNSKNRKQLQKLTVGFLKDPIEKVMIKTILIEYGNQNVLPSDLCNTSIYQNRFAVNYEFSKINVNVYLRHHGKEEQHRIKLFPHLLRHSRLTNLVNQFGFNMIDLMRVAGWSDSKMTMTYVAFQKAGLEKYALSK